MRYEIISISMKSVVFSVVPVIVAVMSLIAALITYVVVPDISVKGSSFVRQVAMIVTFTLVNTVVFSAFIALTVFVYNLFCSGFGLRGVVVEFNAAEESESPEK
ncbi:MAG TPA: hypothetical protein VMW66_04100 [Elusimicrobiales bacterium]|nr:hypothetical protein [Elusimicrobiales bacterium]